MKETILNALLSFSLRVVFGVLAIYLINSVYIRFGLSSHVAINEVNVCVCGILGLPGVGLLYGISYLLNIC